MLCPHPFNNHLYLPNDVCCISQPARHLSSLRNHALPHLLVFLVRQSILVVPGGLPNHRLSSLHRAVLYSFSRQTNKERGNTQTKADFSQLCDAETLTEGKRERQNYTQEQALVT